MVLVVYRYVTTMFMALEDYNNPPVVSSANSELVNKYFKPKIATTPSSIQVEDMTEQELRGYDGSDPHKPILMVIKAQIYDVFIRSVYILGHNQRTLLEKMSSKVRDFAGGAKLKFQRRKSLRSNPNKPLLMVIKAQI
ncbi:membrane steroid-binding protein 1-like [Rosa chinensis]|uniref:membrane steroid-binding protein 1-like n=1 Tax=Rosa chinensis TaxID=74649 RepID=UPI000D08BB84|nr:membrane steroid-binding protein 1-like [Rosa chinensis]